MLINNTGVHKSSYYNCSINKYIINTYFKQCNKYNNDYMTLLYVHYKFFKTYLFNAISLITDTAPITPNCWYLQKQIGQLINSQHYMYGYVIVLYWTFKGNKNADKKRNAIPQLIPINSTMSCNLALKKMSL